jgi:DnaJ-class molecular chaperone
MTTSNQGLNLFQMAEQIAKNIPDSEKDAMKNMDMEQMFGNLSKQVFSQMKDLNLDNLGLPTNNDNTLVKPKKKRRKKKKNKKTKDLNFQIEFTLKDLYMGKVKKIMIPRNNFNDEGPYIEKKQFEIDIKAGTPDQHIFVLEGEGDREPGYISGDIHVTICEKNHEVFEREDNNLFMQYPISVYELYFLEIKFKHLDGRIIQIEPLHNGDLQNGLMKKIKGEGFVDLDTGDKGDLFIRFELVLPPVMAEDTQDNLKILFPPIMESNEEEVSVTLKLEDMSDDDEQYLDMSDSDSNSSSDDEEDSSDNEELIDTTSD